MSKYVYILMVFLFVGAIQCSANDDKTKVHEDTMQVAMYVHVNNAYYKGDSIPNVTLHTFYCSPSPRFKSQQAKEKYDRWVANIKYVFPLAQLVRQTLIETYDYMQTLPNEKARKEHILLVEKGVKEQYTPLVRRMSRTQGKILVKLINRECGQSSYEMVKAFLGPLRAGFYQVFAGLYGNSLTKKYDPEGEDKEMERIVKKIESGQI